MLLRNKILAVVFLVLAAGCVEENLEAPAEKPGNGGTCISFRSAAPELVMTRASEGDSRVENAVVFVFIGEDCVAKQWSYIGEDKKMYMYLPSGTIDIYAVCNLLDPETVMNRVDDLDDLKNEVLTISDWSEAYRGKYVMSGSLQSVSKPADDGFLTIDVVRVAAQFNVNIAFAPVNSGESFNISEVAIHNVPSGTWLLPRNSISRIPDQSLVSNPEFSLSETGSKDDWTYDDTEGNMGVKFFSDGILSMEEVSPVTVSASEEVQWQQTTSFSIFENRRGVLGTELSDPPLATDPFAVNWPDLYLRSETQRADFAQLWKKELADKICKTDHALNAGMKFSTCLTIKGVYFTSSGQKQETTFHVYLGKDNFSDFDVERNYRYDMDIVIYAIDGADTRVKQESLNGIKLYYNEESVLDAHCNSVKTLLYSPDTWEVWVENPDETPWLELSTFSEYKPQFPGETVANENAGFKISGGLGMQYIYVHTDEYVPDFGSPEENNSAPVREGKICYRQSGKSETGSFTVRQYPAQMVILYIEHDVNNLMKEVRDTFYIERVLEKKHLKWGFERYWSMEVDNMISSGQWDGLNNTRRLYDAATVGDEYSGPAYYIDGGGNGENCIPLDVALRNVVDKNRDRNGNGYIDRDEIMWFMPAINEMEALYDAKEQLLVEFEGDDDYFFSSTPSSSDPVGITDGYAYYIKMGNGKTGLAQRNMEYNFIACRRTNAWRGPETAAGTGTVTKDEVWEEEDVIMPKN